MSRIGCSFARARAEGRAALIPFVEAFDPDPETTAALLAGLAEAGADAIEVGIPFSDPMADGPTIQRAGQRALKAGATLAGTLGLIRAFRHRNDTVPVVLMGYFNPILAYGVASFCSDAAAAGVDGVIVVDLPPEESEELDRPARAAGLDVVRLVAPTTGPDRLPIVLQGASGFVYYVSITGITGTRTATEAHLAEAIPRLRAATSLPIAVGFGVRTPEQAATVARHADAAVVASALIDTVAAGLDEWGRLKPGTVAAVLDQVRALASAVRTAPTAAAA